LRLYTHTHTGDCLLENKKINLNNAEILNKNIKLNKGRTTPIFNNGIGLSLSAFWKKIKSYKNNKYLIRYKEVRAGPKNF